MLLNFLQEHTRMLNEFIIMHNKLSMKFQFENLHDSNQRMVKESKLKLESKRIKFQESL